jgi:hypothetical protein
VRNASLVMQRCIAKLRQGGEETQFTKVFHHFPQAVQDALLSVLQPRPDEQPIIACVQNKETWALITSQRLAWFNNETLTQLEWAEVESSAVHDIEAIANNPLAKLERNQLTVVTVTKEVFQVPLDPEAFHGFWGAVSVMIKTGRRKEGKDG